MQNKYKCRECLRAIKGKSLESQPRFKQFVLREFRKNAFESGLTTRDIDATEYLLRKGKKQLETLKMPMITDIQ